MNGEDAYSLQFVALDSLSVEFLFPRLNQGINAVIVFYHELSQIVTEGTDISALGLQTTQLKNSIKALNQFVERHHQQFVKMADIGFGQ